MPFSYEIASVRNAPPTATVGAPFQITLVVDGADARNGDQYQIRFPPGVVAFPTPLVTITGVTPLNPEARLVFDAPAGFLNTGNVGLAFHRVQNPNAVLTVTVLVTAVQPQPNPQLAPQLQPAQTLQTTQGQTTTLQPAPRHWSLDMFLNIGAGAALIIFGLILYHLITFIGSMPNRGLGSSPSRSTENSGAVFHAADDVNVYYGEKEQPEGK